jgi:formate/nitrite transporter FocA (FNT family)
VALGFKHSIANMYLIPIAMLAGAGQTGSRRSATGGPAGRSDG